MQRSIFYDGVEERLTHLATRIKVRAKGNILNLNIHAENFFVSFLNLLYSWDLKNINAETKNSAGIDLLDEGSKLIAQVSGTTRKAKVQTSLNSPKLKPYAGHAYKFIAIAPDVTSLRKQTFSNPHKFTFTPKDDCIAIDTLLDAMQQLHIDSQRALHDLVLSELGPPVPPARLNSGLAALITILAKENLGQPPPKTTRLAFDLNEKVAFNNLRRATTLIDDHKVQHARVQGLYDSFDREGNNRSMSILAYVRRLYLQKKQTADPDSIFHSIIADVIELASHAAQQQGMSHEELDLCAQIVVVDAFMRCKIFETPAAAP